MWHQQADYNTYRAFFNNLSSELQLDVDLELRIPEIMELGTDDEKANRMFNQLKTLGFISS
jgi:hypothetical protein